MSDKPTRRELLDDAQNSVGTAVESALGWVAMGMIVLCVLLVVLQLAAVAAPLLALALVVTFLTPGVKFFKRLARRRMRD